MSEEDQSLSNTILFVDHHDNQMDDLAWTHLGQIGFERRLVCPFRGESLDIDPARLAGVVVYGGSQNVDEQKQHPFLKQEIRWLERCLASRTPTLGICLGGQLLAHTLGAKVGPRRPRECEFGFYEVTPTSQDDDFMTAPMSLTEAHFQEFDLPANAVRLAGSAAFENQAFRYDDFAFGVQFHPEVTADIFRRWQDAEWAMFDVKGAQTREQQDALIDHHSERQGLWFKRTLETLFGSPDAPRSIDSPH